MHSLDERVDGDALVSVSGEHRAVVAGAERRAGHVERAHERVDELELFGAAAPHYFRSSLNA